MDLNPDGKTRGQAKCEWNSKTKNTCKDKKQPQQGTRNQLQAAGWRPGVRDLAYDTEHAQGPSVSLFSSLPIRIHLIHQAYFFGKGDARANNVSPCLPKWRAATSPTQPNQTQRAMQQQRAYLLLYAKRDGNPQRLNKSTPFHLFTKNSQEKWTQIQIGKKRGKAECE